MKPTQIRKPLALLLALIMAFSLLPMTALAEGENSIKTTMSYQANDTGFIIAPSPFDVSANIAETFGFTDTGNSEEVTALDAIVTAHVAIFGDGPEAIEAVLEVDPDNGFVKNFMGDGTGDFVYLVNGVLAKVPAGETLLENGDRIELFAMQNDEYGLYSDAYAWFEQEGQKLESLTVYTDESVDLALMGINYFIWGEVGETDPTVGPIKITGLEDAEIVIATREGSGAGFDVAYFEPLDPALYPDEGGEITLRFDTAGTYILSAIGHDSIFGTPLMSPWLVVTVEDAPDIPEAGAFSSLIMASNNAKTELLTLDPAFSPYVTEYDVTVSDAVASVWAQAVKGNPDHYMMYMNYPYATGSSGSTLSSGNWSNGLSTAINSTANRNTLRLYVGPTPMAGSGGAWQQDNTAYTINFWRQLSLESLAVDEAVTALDPVFDKDTLAYIAAVPADTETVHITPTSSTTAFTYDLEVNGVPTTSGAAAEITPVWDTEGKAQVSVHVGYTVNETTGNYDINAIPTTYTITLVKVGLSSTPIMLTQPKSAVYLDTVDSEAVAPLLAQATASGTISYQWYKNTVTGDPGGGGWTAIPGAAEMAYTPEVGSVSENQTAYYYCEAANGDQRIKSNVASVTVKPDPTPFNLTVTKADGSALSESRYDYAQGDPGMVLKVTAQSRVEGGTWSYQWWARGGLTGTGGSNAGTADTVTVATHNDGIRRYDCDVTYTVDGVAYKVRSPQSPPVYVTATSVATPVIGTQPKSAEYVINSTAVTNLTVRASRSDTGVLSYQWYTGTDGTDKSTFTAIAGATGTSYKPAALEQPGSVFYYCAVKSTLESISGETYVSPLVDSEIAEIKFYALDLSVWDGEGTAEQPFLIKNQADLINLRNMVNGGEPLQGYHFEMTANITLPAGWVPIGALKTGETSTGNGTNIWPFSGSFDGGGYTLTVPSGGLPLFAYVRYAAVKNLTIYGTKIAGYGLVNNFTVDYGPSGNYNQYTANGYPVTIDIENVTIKAGTTTQKAGFIGGFASGANVVNITNCTAEAGVTIGYDRDQQQIGSFAGTLSGTMDNCVSYANVYGISGVGGLVGTKGEAMGPCVMKNSIFAGTVTATGSYVGGICGRGYGSSSAPNAPLVSIQNCYVIGSVTGDNAVGGILGGEPAVYQAWANGAGYIQNNFVFGSVSATGGSYVGGTIGYMRSLNRYNIIENNYYLDTNEIKGIGFAHIIDTDCATRDTSDPAVRYINTKGNSSTTPVDGIGFGADRNRSDDPSGADAAKLSQAASALAFQDGTVMAALSAGMNGRSWKQGADYPEFSSEAYITEVTASGYQAQYYIGDSFTTAGMALSVKYSDKTTQTVTDLTGVVFSGFDSATAGGKTISGEYGSKQFSFDILVIYAPPPAGETYKASISVTDPGATGGQTKTYFPRTSIELNEGETAFSLLERTGLTLRTSSHPIYSGVYVEAINGFGEFDAGALSGWMYKVNGVFPEYSASLYVLKNADVVEWIYTRDLGEDVGGGYVGGGTVPGAGTGGVGAEVKPNVDKGAAVAEVKSDVIKGLIADAKTGSASDVVITVTNTENVDKVEVNLIAESVSELMKNGLGLTVKSGMALITFDTQALKAIADGQSNNEVVKLTAAAVPQADLSEEQRAAAGDSPVVDLSVWSGNTRIDSFGGTVTVSLPYTPPAGMKAGDYDLLTVYYLSADGTIQEMKGSKYDAKTGMITFTTDHFSKFFSAEWINPFSDITKSDWFYKNVRYAVQNELFNGTSETTFSPNSTMTRAMLVTVLHRLEGKPAVTGTNSFTDVKDGEWYTDAVIWATANGIVGGYGNDLFGTNDPITREQMATMLLRYAEYKKYDTSKSNDLAAYTDANSIASYALDAMKWANAEGLITGRTATTLAPTGTATRAEVATILMRFAENVVK